jgi:nucleoside-diphosphate kinase
MERTLVIIKPDGVKRGLVGEIVSRLENRGLQLIALKMLQPDKALAQRLYAIHEGKSFYESLVEFISSGPIVAAVFGGRGAVEVVRRIMGETDPLKAQPGTIRGDLALDIEHNLIHGSDSGESAEREIPLFFKEEEIIK